MRILSVAFSFFATSAAAQDATLATPTRSFFAASTAAQETVVSTPTHLRDLKGMGMSSMGMSSMGMSSSSMTPKAMTPKTPKTHWAVSCPANIVTIPDENYMNTDGMYFACTDTFESDEGILLNFDGSFVYVSLNP